eukprot:764089-Hanusia_phi.AAC.6
MPGRSCNLGVTVNHMMTTILSNNHAHRLTRVSLTDDPFRYSMPGRSAAVSRCPGPTVLYY